MFVLGLQGSPRRKGNTHFLLSAFLTEMEKRGAETMAVHVPEKKIRPCTGCNACERKGVCSLQDDEMKDLYPLFRRADIVVAATPIYFYNATAQLKIVIDRSQTLWSRKYKLDLTDPGRPHRKGILLSLGATKGKNLFEGMHLTARYFFDAVGAGYAGSLTYWRIEEIGDMKNHPGVLDDVGQLAEKVDPLFKRKKILFACRENAGRSQMAGAFARFYAGDKIDVMTAGSSPAAAINPLMVKVMAEKGLDLAFIQPQSLDTVLSKTTPDMIVTMGCGEECPFIPGTKRMDWDLPDPAGQDEDFVRRVRDEIEERVKQLIAEVTGTSPLVDA